MDNPITRITDGFGDLLTERQLRRFRDLDEASLSEEFRIVIFGEFSRGKSTLINALLGRDVLAASLLPTTGHITRITGGSEAKVRVLLANGQVEEASIKELRSLTVLNWSARGVRNDIDTVEVVVDCPVLRKGIVLVDTPGVVDEASQTARAERAVATASLVVLVLDARQLLTECELLLAVPWMVSELGKPLVPVINFLNQVDEAGKSEIRQRLRAWCQSGIPQEYERPWFEVNALGALKHELFGAARPDDDYAAFRSQVFDPSPSVRTALRARGVFGQTRAEIETARVENKGVVRRLQDDAAGVRRERLNVQSVLHQRSRHLEAMISLEIGHFTSAASTILDDHLAKVIRWFQGESKESLENYASTWYDGRMSEAVALIEENGNAALSKLAQGADQRADPLAIRERLIMNARLDVGSLASIGPSNDTVRDAAVAGSLIAGAVFPVVGHLVGGVVCGVLAKIFGTTEPDYPAHYSAAARERWKTFHQDVMGALHRQVDSQLEVFRSQIQRQIVHNLSAAGISDDVLLERAKSIWFQRGQPDGETKDRIWEEVQILLLSEAAATASAGREITRRLQFDSELARAADWTRSQLPNHTGSQRAGAN